MKNKKYLLAILLGFIVFPIVAQESCGDYLKYYDAGDYENTISTILDCKSKNAFSEQELDKAEFYLQLSYVISGDIIDFDLNVLERLCLSGNFNNTASIVITYFALSNIYLDKRDYEKAILYGEQSLYYANKHLDHFSSDFLGVISYIVDLYVALDDMIKASEYGEQMIKVKKAVIGVEDPEYIATLKGLGALYYQIEDYENAIKCEEEVLEIIKETEDDEHPDYASSLSRLGLYHFGLGHSDKTIALEEQALQIYKMDQGEYDFDYAYTLSRIGNYYYTLLDYQKAIECEEEVLKIMKKIAGVDDHDYVSSLYKLANYYFTLGEYDKAISTFQDCKSKNSLSDEELSKAEFYLQISHAITGDIDNFDIDVLERLCLSDNFNNTSSIIVAYYMLSTYHYSRSNYEKAIELGEKSLFFAKQYYDYFSSDYLTVISFLANMYIKQNQFSEGVEYGEKVVEIQKSILGEEHPEHISSLSSLGDYNYYMGNYDRAIEYEEKVLSINKIVYGVEHHNYASSLSKLGLYYSAIGDYRKAIEISMQALNIQESLFGQHHPDYAMSLNNIGGYYSYLGDYSIAIEYAEQALNIQELVCGQSHPDYAKSLNNLGSYYSSLGDYRKAVEYADRALNIRKSLFDENHPDYAASLSNLGVYNFGLGDYGKAIEYGEKASEIYKSLFGENHPSYVTSLNNLGLYYSDLGDYRKAIEYGEQALEVRESVFGENHPDYAVSLNNLSLFYSDLGDYRKAIEYGEQALKAQESVFGRNHPDFASSLSNLGSYYSDLGDYCKAIEYGEEALKVRESVFGRNHPDYALSLNNLGSYYSDLRDYYKAIEYAEQALSINEFLFGQHHPSYALSSSNLGDCYYSLGDYRKAIEYGEQALKIREYLFGQNHTSYAMSLSNLASCYSALGDQNKAIKFGKQALKIRESILGENHPDYVLSLFNLGTHCFYIQDYDYSLRLISNGNKVKAKRIKSEFSWLAEYERGLYWAKEKYSFTSMPRYCYLSNNYSGFPELSYNSTLLSKGMLLQSSIELNKLLMESGDEEVINKAEDLRILRATLNKLYEKPLVERHLNTDSLEQISSKLERDLLSMSKEYGDYTRFMDVNWEDVQAKLSEKDVAIEIVEFPVFKSDSVMYAAMVLRKDWEQPQMIPLFEKKEIVSFMDQTPSKQYTGYVGKQLYKLMWKPLESVVEEGDNVYFSPSGVYHQLAMEYLPTEEGTPLCDIYNMHRLSSTRQLVLENRDVAHKEAVLYGGIRYDVESDEMLAESKKYQQDESLYAQRGMMVDSLRGSQWVSLANTIPEVNFISGELEKYGIKSKVYSDTEANEESIKALSGKKVNILHLATHGFFLPIEETKKVEFYQMMGMDNNPAPDISMRRSGLIMAGGNGVWTGKSIPEGVDDGVLTAQEISVLDFREMDMVVLSACETALGDIDTSEGVFGLQRAFKKAGVNTLLMSLWKVNDEVTKTLMNKFYQTLLSGKSKREAFLEAQRFVRNSHPDPKDWAAFVMVD